VTKTAEAIAKNVEAEETEKDVARVHQVEEAVALAVNMKSTHIPPAVINIHANAKTDTEIVVMSLVAIGTGIELNELNIQDVIATIEDHHAENEEVIGNCLTTDEEEAEAEEIEEVAVDEVEEDSVDGDKTGKEVQVRLVSQKSLHLT
jgi:hypothetical protein